MFEQTFPLPQRWAGLDRVKVTALANCAFDAPIMAMLTQRRVVWRPMGIGRESWATFPTD